MKAIKIKRSNYYLALFIISTLFVSCSGSNNSEEYESEPEEEIVVVEDVWIVGEHSMNDIALTSMADMESADEIAEEAEVDADAEMAKEEAEEEAVAEADIEAEEEAEAEEEYEIATMEALQEQMEMAEYIADNTFIVTEVAVPIDETQTVVAYNKKGEATAGVQVISNADGEVEQVIFQDKKHSDEYDVQAGMSAKEVKKLRKELKHMVKHGQVFLYDDTSNIMYLTDIQNLSGDEITVAEVDQSEITAIIWKDKKHHKKKDDQ